MASPYQPLLFRILHGINGLLVLGALITGFWVYNTYDGRFGRIALPSLADIQGIHGTIALTFLLFFPLFAIYSFHAGQKRLIQPDSFRNLTQLSRPIGWFSLHRIVNTAMLVASVFALISGRLMKEEWLPNGEYYHLAYAGHLIAWLTLIVGLFIHILMAARVGGAALIRSTFQANVRPSDPVFQMMDNFKNYLNRTRNKS